MAKNVGFIFNHSMLYIINLPWLYMLSLQFIKFICNLGFNTLARMIFFSLLFYLYDIPLYNPYIV